MAHALNTSQQIILHQFLHGYSDGHRLLDSSATLSAKDAKLMLILSDASGPGAAISKDGYLTGYPLLETGSFALARTWAAPEISRSGCVWTHTILIDFADLASLPSTSALNTLFTKPAALSIFDTYRFPIELDLSFFRSLPSDADFDGKEANRLLRALYAHPGEQITNPWSVKIDTLILLLWSQQWPKLRRNFRFCSQAYSDRSNAELPFDIQVMPPKEKGLRPRFAKALDAEKLLVTAAGPWLTIALNDLALDRETPLRKFFRDSAGEISGGRELFIPLCNLHILMSDSNNLAESLDQAVTLVQESFTVDSAPLINGVLASMAARHAAIVSENTLHFVIARLKLIAWKDLNELGTKFGTELWRRNPVFLTELSTGDKQQQSVANQTLSALSETQLLDGLRQATTICLPAILRNRYEIVLNSEFWELTRGFEFQTFETAIENSTLVPQILDLISNMERYDLATASANSFGNLKVFEALNRLLSEQSGGMPKVSNFLDILIDRRNFLTEALTTLTKVDKQMLYLISSKTAPDFVWQGDDEDPWANALRHSTGSLPMYESQFLSAYLFYRAIKGYSKNREYLIASSLEELYFAALHSSLSEQAWMMVKPCLPKPPWFHEWDRCLQLRMAVCETFVRQHLSITAFLKITSDDRLFEELIYTTWELGKSGKRFIRDAAEAAQHPGYANSKKEVLSRFE